MTEYNTETLRHGQNIITVSRPVLSPAEREKRLSSIKSTAVNLVVAAERLQKRKDATA